jgi:hypothetical protein
MSFVAKFSPGPKTIASFGKWEKQGRNFECVFFKTYSKFRNRIFEASVLGRRIGNKLDLNLTVFPVNSNLIYFFSEAMGKR